jgi:lipopolysaccharide/colanic/teichoic acid biosynthesis glycosyltransferase
MYFDGSTEVLSDTDRPWNGVDRQRMAGRIRTGGHELLQARATIICRSRAKRLMDLVGAAVLLTLFAPLMATIAVLICLEGGGPVLFRQQRYGLGRSVFTVLKFRSMRVSEPGHSFRQAARQDARITRIGALLRRTSLDELPQLINVLRGEMSLVGPRPHAIGMDDVYGRILLDYAHRHWVRPGLTGWAQVEGFRGPTDALAAIQSRLRYDRVYIRCWSPWLDLKILLQTPLRLWVPTAF